jgi:hypothetical protein
MDQVICINNIAINQFYPDGVKIDGLTLHKVYTVESYEKVDDDVIVWITDDDNQYFAYMMEDFMLLDKWREQQINKIIE